MVKLNLEKLINKDKSIVKLEYSDTVMVMCKWCCITFNFIKKLKNKSIKLTIAIITY